MNIQLNNDKALDTNNNREDDINHESWEIEEWDDSLDNIDTYFDPLDLMYNA